MKKTRTVLVYLLLASLVAAGVAVAVTQFGLLGGRRVNVSGSITRDGKPLEWQSDAGTLSVVFLPKVRDNTTEVFRADSDRATGRFEIKQIPTGDYIVCVQQLDPDGAHDLLGMVYDPSSTDIERKVTNDGQHFDINLPKELPKRRTPPARMPPRNPPAPNDEEKKEEPKKDAPKKDEAEKKTESK
jgi:hypothetical protein